MVDACSAVFSSIVVLPSAHCCLNSVLFHTKCFHCFLPVLCFMMAILSVNWRFSGWWSWMLCSFFFDRCFACWICSNCWFNTDSFLAQRITVQVMSAASQKYYLKYFYCFFFQCFFSWWQFCPLIGEFYVSDGWFFDFSLIIWGKPSSSQSQITSLKSKITNLKHNSLINGHNCHHKTKHRQEIKL